MGRMTRGALESIKAKLRDAPPKDGSEKPVTILEAISALRPELQRLLDEKNYTHDQLGEYLSSIGMQVSLQTLRAYMARSARVGKRRGSKVSQQPEPEKKSLEHDDVSSRGTTDRTQNERRKNDSGTNRERKEEPKKADSPTGARKPGEKRTSGGFAVREDSENI